MGYAIEQYDLISKSNINNVMETIYGKYLKEKYQLFTTDSESMMEKIREKQNALKKIMTGQSVGRQYRYFEVFTMSNKYPVIAEFTSETGDKILSLQFPTVVPNREGLVLWKIYGATDLMKIMTENQEKPKIDPFEAQRKRRRAFELEMEKRMPQPAKK